MNAFVDVYNNGNHWGNVQKETFFFSFLSYSITFSPPPFFFFIMNSLRSAFNKIPAGTTVKILKKVFSLPAPAARLILNDVTKPRSSHKPWILKVPWNNEWSGCWIGENVNQLNHEELVKRIQNADIIFFNVHGK